MDPQTMLKISILKVENPSCLWGRVVGGSGSDAETAAKYDNLMMQMNLFYHDVTQDLRKLKPKSIEEGQVCVVYWPIMKSWCRAMVESIVMDSMSCAARCILVDHGERIIVPSDQIRVPVETFLQLPFWVRRFHLAGIKPTTLRVSVYEESPEITQSTQWDSSATLYLHNLLQASTWTEAMVLGSETESTSIELYLTVRDIKICVNDDLVAKKFAYYSRESEEVSWLDEVDRLPVMLSRNIFTQNVSHKPAAPPQPAAAAAQPAPALISPPVMSEGLFAGAACDWLTATSLLQNQHRELTTGDGDVRSAVTEEEASPGGQSEQSCGRAAAAAAAAESPQVKMSESKTTCDTDSSLAAALTSNLSLFKCLKFLNPGSSSSSNSSCNNNQQQQQQQQLPPTLEDCVETTAAASSSSCTQQEVNATNMSSKILSGLSGLLSPFHSSEAAAAPVENALHMSSSSSLESEPAEVGRAWRSEENGICSRLLEWLNPDPLNSDPDAAVAADDDVAVPRDPRKNGVLVHSALPVEPCSGLDDAPVTDALRWLLRKKQYGALSPADCYSWPAVARGFNTVVVSPGAEEPLSYLAPLLTHMLLNSVFTSLTSSSGPIAVLLCPGWERVQRVFDLLDDGKLARILHPTSGLLGAGADEAKTFRIPKNCLVLVTTPFSLVRLLAVHCFMFLRLYHLVLDQADLLFTLAPEQMATILQHFQKVTSSEERASCPQQLVAVAKRWTSQMEVLVTNHMPYPCIVMTVPEEAALYGDVQQIILMTQESSKISELLNTLDLNPPVGQKTLIITGSVEEVEDVCKAVHSKSVLCLQAHEKATHQFDFVVQQWSKNVGAGTHVILVTTNECLRCFGIRDATCVVHFDFPASPKVFGTRLFCLADNFRNLSERSFQDQTPSRPRVARSVLLISERNARHVVGVLRYLGRSDAVLTPELLSFARGIRSAREDLKTGRPLCSYLKSFGVCRDGSSCPDRHRFISRLDRSELPAAGVIELVPVYIKTASLFYGRIVRKDDSGGVPFDVLASEMASFYADKKPGAVEILEGGMYAVQEGEDDKDVFHRVKVLSAPVSPDTLFYRVLVRFLDVGKEEEVKSHQILQLPPQFQALPPQAMEMVVCRVKPVDEEVDWHPKVTRAVSLKIRGLQHRARAVLSLGNTVFVDPMVRVTQVPGTKTFINEHNVQSLIMSTGMGMSNLKHVELLRALCKEEEEEEEEDEQQEEQKEVCTVQDGGDASGSRDAGGVPQTAVLAAPPHCCQNGLSAGDGHRSSEQIITNGTESDDSTKSFHPQVRWHQTSDAVTVTVKLTSPEGQRCDVQRDRVVYRGRVDGRSYRAELELRADVVPDRCCWEMKSNEPVIKLVKQQQGQWDKLTRNKNIFVSYDMEHIEEDEDAAPRGQWFVENTGEENTYVVSETDSDSD